MPNCVKITAQGLPGMEKRGDLYYHDRNRKNGIPVTEESIMKQSFLHLKQRAAALAAAAFLAIGSLGLPATAHAFDWGNAVGAVIGASLEYSMLTRQMNYLDGKGRQAFLKSIKERDGVCDEYEANAMLDNVMGRLTTVLEKEDPKLSEKPYNYFVNNNENFNAYCTLGHNLSVNIGLFRMLDYNEDEVAFVVGHELAHGQKNDPASGVRKSFPIILLAAAAGSQGSLLEAMGVNVLANMGTAKMVTLPMEKRADKLGFEYASEAGYNPGAGAALWQRVIEKMGTERQSFLGSVFNPSDHPGNEARRDRYTKRMYEYSGRHVNVDKKTGSVLVNKKVVGLPVSTPSMSSRERAYTVAGRLAKVYHDQPGAIPEASQDGSSLYFGSSRIMTFAAGDEGTAWVAALSRAAGRDTGRRTGKDDGKKSAETKPVKEGQKNAAGDADKKLKKTADGTTSRPVSFRQRVEMRKAAEKAAAAAR